MSSLKIVVNLLPIVFQYLIFLTFLVIAVGSLVILILERRWLVEVLKVSISKGYDSNDQGRLTRLIAWVVGLGTIFAIIWFLPRVGIGELWGSLKPGDVQSPGGAPQPSLPSDILVPNPFPLNLLLVPAIISVAVVLVGGLLLFQAVRETKEESMEVPQEEEVLQKGALNVVREAISNIMIREGDSDYRAALIRCYQKLCELLAESNCRIKEHETVQEFRVSASGSLSIPDGPFSALTNLFEEARYSLHEIDEGKRNEALNCLEEIKDHMVGDQ
jgi:hypothetical protein